MLAAVIRGPTCDAALAEMEKAFPFADLFELRLDFFDDGAHLGEIVSQSRLPILFTFRKQEQGGGRRISERERLEKIEQFLEMGPAYADIEADTDPKFIERIGKKFPEIKLIGSYHNFEKTPEDLGSVLRGMHNPHFSIYKIAVHAQSTIDLLRLMVFAREESKKGSLTCIAMGDLGQPSRVLGPVVGNAIDYSALEEEKGGLFQYSLKTLHERFHYRSLNRETEVFALVVNPVVHSPGDVFHNEIFRKENRNAVYLKLRLDREELESFFPLFRRLPFKGLSVTIPLKETIIALLDQIDPMAAIIGAANTVTRQGSLAIGTNTDASGALNAIEKHFHVENKKIAILGAGGTARAIAYEAKKRGAIVEVFNRTLERAQSLASSLGVKAHPIEEITSRSYDLLINTIPPVEEEIFDYLCIPQKAIVMDVVYRETPLMKTAKQKGCRCIYGEEMFIEQAKLQQLTWKKSPIIQGFPLNKFSQ